MEDYTTTQQTTGSTQSASNISSVEHKEQQDLVKNKSFLYWAVLFFGVAMIVIAVFSAYSKGDIKGSDMSIQNEYQKTMMESEDSQITSELNLSTETNTEDIDRDTQAMDQEIENLAIDDIAL